MHRVSRLFLAVLLPWAAAQTLTTTDVLGNTIVEVVTLDPLGIPTTTILSTITPTPFTSTITTTNRAGNTLVEVISGDGQGLLATQTIQTILAAAGGAFTSTVTTTDPAGETLVEVVVADGSGNTATQTIQTIAAAGPGPVQQPGTTDVAQEGRPTPYTYTTTNANGVTYHTVGTFTPSVATAVPVSATFQATQMDYSFYTANYATSTAPSVVGNEGSRPVASFAVISLAALAACFLLS